MYLAACLCTPISSPLIKAFLRWRILVARFEVFPQPSDVLPFKFSVGRVTDSAPDLSRVTCLHRVGLLSQLPVFKCNMHLSIMGISFVLFTKSEKKY